MSRMKIVVLFGGKSSEHEVSIESAKSVIAAIDQKKYEVIPVYIEKEGRWLLGGEKVRLPFAKATGSKRNKEIRDIREISDNKKGKMVIFPLIHGNFGEDGTMQGFLRILDLPFVGADVLGSAVGMDKDVQKRLLKEAGIPVAEFRVIRPHFAEASWDKEIGGIIKDLGLPLFVKPANSGSSIGVSKVKKEEDLLPALEKAFQFDSKVLLEENIIGREVECSVLGNNSPRVSILGEVVPHDEFYTYEAKYQDDKTELVIPAELSDKVIKKAQGLAVKTFKALCCEGMARVDFFLRGEDELLVNEINTIPGFTSHSMYPKLWEASGLSYSDLINELIQLALERHRRQKRLNGY